MHLPEEGWHVTYFPLTQGLNRQCMWAGCQLWGGEFKYEDGEEIKSLLTFFFCPRQFGAT